jgi:osmotically-inducible protein OsmY
MTKSDQKLKEDIDDELRWDPKVSAAQIGVSVEHGAVSLTGEVTTYAEKRAAAEAVRRVAGVRAVADDLAVKVNGPHQRTDLEIAEAALTALELDVWVPKTVAAIVEQGWLTLTGNVAWNYQRASAERAVRYLAGVVGVTNAIHIEAGTSVSQVEEKVRAALQRQASADAHAIHVEVSGGTVTLSGSASSWHAIEDAAAAAWAAPGVTAVIDQVHMTGF